MFLTFSLKLAIYFKKKVKIPFKLQFCKLEKYSIIAFINYISPHMYYNTHLVQSSKPFLKLTLGEDWTGDTRSKKCARYHVRDWGLILKNPPEQIFLGIFFLSSLKILTWQKIYFFLWTFMKDNGDYPKWSC